MTEPHALAALLTDTPPGYLARALERCTPDELAVITRVVREARLEREMVRDSGGLRAILRCGQAEERP